MKNFKNCSKGEEEVLGGLWATGIFMSNLNSLVPEVKAFIRTNSETDGLDRLVVIDRGQKYIYE